MVVTSETSGCPKWDKCLSEVGQVLVPLWDSCGTVYACIVSVVSVLSVECGVNFGDCTFSTDFQEGATVKYVMRGNFLYLYHGYMRVI